MKPSIPKWERRDYLVKDYRDKSIWPKLAVILIVGVIAGMLYVVTPTVRATSTINWNDVHSTEAACSYFFLYPEKITNQKQYKENCL